MGGSLTDKIEQYIKSLFIKNNKAYIEISRQDLAQQFSCVPSQINYVLNTRFTFEQGYIIESRRGGGGYLKVVKLPSQGRGDIKAILKQVGDKLSQNEAKQYVLRFLEAEFITKREAQIILAAIHRDSLAVDLPARDYIRANVFKAILLVIARNDI